MLSENRWLTLIAEWCFVMAISRYGYNTYYEVSVIEKLKGAQIYWLATLPKVGKAIAIPAIHSKKFGVK